VLQDSGFDLAIVPKFGKNMQKVSLSEGFGMALSSVAWVCSVVSLVQTFMDEDATVVEKVVATVQFGLGTASLIVSIVGAVATQAATAASMTALSNILGPVTSLVGGLFQLYKGYNDLQTYGAADRGKMRLVAGVAMIGSGAMGILIAAGVFASTGIGLIVSVALLAISVVALVAASFMKGPIEPEFPAPGDDQLTIGNAIRYGLLREKIFVGVPTGEDYNDDALGLNARGNIFENCGTIPADVAGSSVESYKE
jgi:hypothetical protein